MAATTGIQWADATFNPWIGCTKVGPGCDHCYAEAWDRRFATSGHAMRWGTGKARTRTSAATWKQPLKWNKRAEFMPHRPRVFCASLADWLDNEVPIAWFIDLLDVIRRAVELDWLLLTKRIGNFQNRLAAAINWCEGTGHDPVVTEWMRAWLAGTPPANVWMGATVVNQAEADRDIPKLLSIPAAVRFLSIEPMLGPVTLNIDIPGSYPGYNALNPYRPTPCTQPMQPKIHWVICGGESGTKARPMHPDWARNLRDQCAAAGVPFFFKQWGEWFPRDQWEHNPDLILPDDDYVACEHGDKKALRFSDGEIMHRVGKARAGRLLDGIEHNAFPDPRQAVTP